MNPWTWLGDRILGGGPSASRGMLLMAFSTMCGAATNAVIRYLAPEMHPFEIAFFRCLFGLVTFAPLFIQHGFGPLRTRRFPLHLVRGALQGATMMMSFMALRLTPLAKVAALQFTMPLFGTLLAVLVLGEAIRARRLTALLVGFFGAVVIVGPAWSGIDLGATLVLGAAAVSALGMIAVKMLARTDSSTTIALYSTMLVTPFTFLAALPVWTVPTLVQLGWLALLGAFATISSITFAQALKDADITVVAPIEFTKLIWSAWIGYLVFVEIPETSTWIGAVIIFSASTYIMFRERRLRGAPVVPPRPD